MSFDGFRVDKVVILAEGGGWWSFGCGLEGAKLTAEVGCYHFLHQQFYIPKSFFLNWRPKPVLFFLQGAPPVCFLTLAKEVNDRFRRGYKVPKD